MLMQPMRQRGAIRRAIQVPCTLVRAKDLKVIGKKSLDLSEDGMLVGAMDELAFGDQVMVSFTFTPFAIPFHVEGTVARFLRGRRTTDRMPAAAVRFESLDAVSRLILRGNLRRIPPTLPARARRVDYAATVMSLLT
ncbi:MAG: PilZ domain-containing protein [Myxococcales bacterium]|nr:PilZ domain-containing protein [Myxococcales bacterium]